MNNKTKRVNYELERMKEWEYELVWERVWERVESDSDKKG